MINEKVSLWFVLWWLFMLAWAIAMPILWGIALLKPFSAVGFLEWGLMTFLCFGLVCMLFNDSKD